jgi:hypothetical protein
LRSSFQRRSPVLFPGRPVRTEFRDDWSVVLEYEGEGDGPYLIDLSHRSRWDVQDREITKYAPWGVAVPEKPGESLLEKGVLISRMNQSQASAWQLAGQMRDPAEGSAFSAFTETTESSFFLALLGKQTFSTAEKLTSLDLLDPEKKVPFLLQGPILRIPGQLVVLGRNEVDGAILLTCSRKYAHDIVQGILEAGEEFGLRPAGEEAFSRWLESVSG